MRNSLPVAVGLAASLALAAVVRAASPYVVADINPFAEPASSAPDMFAAFDGVAVFAASDVNGREIWRSDGTAAGTFQLADLCPGACSSDPRTVTATPAGVFFTALPAASDLRQLFLTRGSSGDVVALPARIVSAAPELVWSPALHRLFFTGFDTAGGSELWVSDGTASGTRRVDLLPGTTSSYPSWLTPIGNRVVMLAAPGVTLWSSDGTAAGTTSIGPTTPRQRFVWADELTPLGSKALFLASTAAGGFQLWATDGTSRGTVAVTRLFRGPATLLREMFPVGNRVFFVVGSVSGGDELWVTDGTAKGTRQLSSFGPQHPFDGGNYPAPAQAGALGSRLLFMADDGQHGFEPWISDGTTKGTRMIADLCSGACGGRFYPLATLGTRMVFDALDPTHGMEVWATDGTAAGTHLVADLCPGSCSSYAFPVAALGGKELIGTWSGDQTRSAVELWSTDGTAGGTVDLGAVGTVDSGLDLPRGVTIGGLALFAARDDSHGRELWRTDGTPAGTSLLADIADLDLGGSLPHLLSAVGERLDFLANDGVHGIEPWTTDGTAAGTHLVADVVPGSGGLTAFASDPGISAVVGNQFFLVDDALGLVRTDGTEAGTLVLHDGPGPFLSGLARAGNRLVFTVSLDGAWVSDGTLGGTQPLALGPTMVTSSVLSTSGSRFYFAGSMPDAGDELWTSDGTAAGTSRLADILPGSDSSYPRALTADASGFYFLAQAEQGGTDLWHSDGTVAGTHRIATLDSFSDRAGGARIVTAGSRAYVLVSNVGLWVCDGTAASTHRLSVPVPAAPFSAPASVAAVGNVVYFSGLGPADDLVLWRSDGTDAGTFPLLDAHGATFGEATSLTAFAGRLAFVAADAGDSALYLSDGTAAGTRVVQRMTAAGSGSDGELAVAGNKLYFAAPSPQGVELWALPAN